MSKRIIKIPNIKDEIDLALKHGYHRFILTVGEKNLGKSTLNLLLLHEIFNDGFRSPTEAWVEAFKHLCFTPRQFYEKYIEVKDRIDKELMRVGLPSSILDMDIETEWGSIIEMVIGLKGDVQAFTKYRESYRIPALLVDDMGAHMNRQDVSIYYNPFFQQLFADLTLIRPYIACLLATCPKVSDLPRSVLKHVTDVIHVTGQGRAKYRKIRDFIKFRGANVEGFLKLYDGDPIHWDPLPKDIYAKYEILRHLPSRKVSQKAKLALIEADMKLGYTPPTLH